MRVHNSARCQVRRAVRYAVIMHKFSPVERVLATWVIGVFVSVTLAFGALFALNRLVYTPTGQVQEYFRALQDVMVRMRSVFWGRGYLRVTVLFSMVRF